MLDAQPAPDAHPRPLPPAIAIDPPASQARPVQCDAIFAAARILLPVLETGRPLDATTLRDAMTEAFGATDSSGAWLWKDAYEAAEGAAVLFLQRYGRGMRCNAGAGPDGTRRMLAMLEAVAALEPSHRRQHLTACTEPLKNLLASPGASIDAASPKAYGPSAQDPATPGCSRPAPRPTRAGVPPRAAAPDRRPTRSIRPRNRRSPSCVVRLEDRTGKGHLRSWRAWRFRGLDRSALDNELLSDSNDLGHVRRYIITPRRIKRDREFAFCLIVTESRVGSVNDSYGA